MDKPPSTGANHFRLGGSRCSLDIEIFNLYREKERDIYNDRWIFKYMYYYIHIDKYVYYIYIYI